MIITGAQTQAYADGWERIWGDRDRYNNAIKELMEMYDDLEHSADPNSPEPDILAFAPYGNIPRRSAD